MAQQPAHRHPCKTKAGLRGGPPALRDTREIPIEFRFAETVQIFEGFRHRAALELGARFDRGVIVGSQMGHGEEVESVHPEDLVCNGVELDYVTAKRGRV